MVPHSLAYPQLGGVSQQLRSPTRLEPVRRQRAASVALKEAAVDAGEDPLGRLITEIGRAARAGWAPTARLIALLAVTAGAVALVLVTSR